METKFTKGQWEVLPATTGFGNVVVCDRQKIAVASLQTKKPSGVLNYYPDVTDNEVEANANAKLIAAAPELLDALVKLVALRQRDCYNLFGYEEDAVINAASIAVNKAV